MSIGSSVRAILGPKLFKHAGHVYRSMFVDLRKVADTASEFLPPNAHVLDIGGGDGAPLNYLLHLRPDIRVTMIDTSPVIGGALHKGLLSRITMLPATGVQAYDQKYSSKLDAILICDVVHHITPVERVKFFEDVWLLLRKNNGARLIIKDVEPEGLCGLFVYLSDRYISGDKTVSLIHKRDLISLLKVAPEEISITETQLYSRNSPNYSIVIAFLGGGASL